MSFIFIPPGYTHYPKNLQTKIHNRLYRKIKSVHPHARGLKISRFLRKHSWSILVRIPSEIVINNS